MRQIDALNEQIAQFKQANQGKLPEGGDTDQATRSLESQYVALMEQLGNLRQIFGEHNSQVVALMSQIEALRKQISATSASCVGLPFTHLEVTGVPDRERDELASRVTLKLGEVLSQESIDGAIAALRDFDWRLECRFLRAANGDVILRITGPERQK
jgi:capsule polysaccharide export protein KpsE/RkpR